MAAVDAIVDHLKTLSRPVTTPEEIAQVRMAEYVDKIVYFLTFPSFITQFSLFRNGRLNIFIVF